MNKIIEGFFTFFVPLFMILVHYWYISVPVVALLIILYIKTNKETIRRIIRIILAFVLLAIIFTGIYMLIKQ